MIRWDTRLSDTLARHPRYIVYVHTISTLRDSVEKIKKECAWGGSKTCCTDIPCQSGYFRLYCDITTAIPDPLFYTYT